APGDVRPPTTALAPARAASVLPDWTVTFWPKVEVAFTAARVSDPPDAINRPAVVSFSERTAKLPVPVVMVPTPALLIVTSSPLVGTALFDQLPASPQLRVPALPVQATAAGASRCSSPSRRGFRYRAVLFRGRERLLREVGVGNLQLRNQDCKSIGAPQWQRCQVSARGQVGVLLSRD